MEIIPLHKVGDFEFEQSIDLFKEKINHLKYESSLGERMEMDKTFPSLHLPTLNLYVVFTPDGSRVRYFESDGDIFYQDSNLHSMTLKEAETFLTRFDDGLVLDQESVDSKKLGIMISQNPDKPGNLVMIYDESYKDEEPITPDDLINFYLG